MTASNASALSDGPARYARSLLAKILNDYSGLTWHLTLTKQPSQYFRTLVKLGFTLIYQLPSERKRRLIEDALIRSLESASLFDGGSALGVMPDYSEVSGCDTGLGLRATRDFHRGECIAVVLGAIIPENRQQLHGLSSSSGQLKPLTQSAKVEDWRRKYSFKISFPGASEDAVVDTFQ